MVRLSIPAIQAGSQVQDIGGIFYGGLGGSIPGVIVSSGSISETATEGEEEEEGDRPAYVLHCKECRTSDGQILI